MKKLIIGGGVSGLVCAVQSARAGHSVTLLEADKRIGKKIAASGNGRCNMDNINTTIECYNNSSVARRVVGNISVKQCISFWESIGIVTYADSFGRVYPVTDNSHTVVDCLRYACQRLGVNIVCESKVVEVKHTGNTFAVVVSNGTQYKADQVIAACGSNSQIKIAEHSNFIPKQYLTSLNPTLTPISVKNPEVVLNGIRSKCNMVLKSGNAVLAKSSGEVLFREYGLSGICTMDLSATIARRSVEGQAMDYSIEIDLLPTLEYNELVNMLQGRIADGYSKEQLFCGILHNKVAEVILKRSATGSTLYAKKLADSAKHFVYQVDKLCGFQYSQVTAGGIADRYVDDNLCLPNGVYALGEILDVDGLCGGYNIHFATASALYYCLKQDGKIYD